MSREFRRRELGGCANVSCENNAREGRMEVVHLRGLTLILCSPCASLLDPNHVREEHEEVATKW